MDCTDEILRTLRDAGCNRVNTYHRNGGECMRRLLSALLSFACLFSTVAPVIAEENMMSYGIVAYTVRRDGMQIYGELYLPEAEAPHPLVIMSHGFGGNHRSCEYYADAFARNGIAAYVYDFIGGGRGSQSDGDMTEMSVLTEAADLGAVLDQLKAREDMDERRIYLFGESQGGFVSTYVAGTRPDDVAGLIALYPAYVLQDDARKRTPDVNNIPETMSVMGMTIGAIYNRDALSFDIYDIMAGYTGKTLIIHGTADSIVPISYSERAIETFPDAELIRIGGANHGFYGHDQESAAQAAVDFVKDLLENGQEAVWQMRLIIGETEVPVLWEDNASVEALQELLPLTIQMSMYGGFEQVGPVGQSITRNDRQTTTDYGDIVLYSGNQIVVFYGSNSWAYTRLGHINLTRQEMTDLLGHGDVTITLVK